MASNGSQDRIEEIQNKTESGKATDPPKLQGYSIRIPPRHRGLVVDRSKWAKLRDQLKAGTPSTPWSNEFRIPSPMAALQRTVSRREEISLAVPSPAGIRRRLPLHILRKINYASFFTMCMRWLKHPLNLALLLWLICVGVSGAMLGLLLLGLLDQAFPTKELRNYWTEINNQVLNGLFTLMSIYQHPILFHHVFLLFRFRSEDVVELRKVYCKDAAYRPHEWAHMMVVVIFLHITCFAQYALCALYWMYTSDNRPDLISNLLFALGVVAPVAAGAYTVYSPLGREHDAESDEESQQGPAVVTDVRQNNKLRLRLYSKRFRVTKPEWVGGLFDLREHFKVTCLSFCCTFCVFGWNMERLGFGNMYVHTFTFLLLCVAPFWILGITALKVHNSVIEDIMGTSGIVLCAFGLLYGGFWRIQMRKRFKLPRNTFCCGSGTMTDYMSWLFCWPCSLAQEVRTGNHYDVQEDSLFYRRRTPAGDLRSPLLQTPTASSSFRSMQTSPLPTSTMVTTPTTGSPYGLLYFVDGSSSSSTAPFNPMKPPVPPVIKIEDRIGARDKAVLSPRSPLRFNDSCPPSTSSTDGSPSTSATGTESNMTDRHSIGELSFKVAPTTTEGECSTRAASTMSLTATEEECSIIDMQSAEEVSSNTASTQSITATEGESSSRDLQTFEEVPTNVASEAVQTGYIPPPLRLGNSVHEEDTSAPQTTSPSMPSEKEDTVSNSDAISETDRLSIVQRTANVVSLLLVLSILWTLLPALIL